MVFGICGQKSYNIIVNQLTKNAFVCIIILLGVLSISFLLSSFSDYGFSDDVEKILSIASSISSLITLLIALVLFNKFGVEQDILQKNLKAVSDIFEVLAKTRISIHTNDGSIHFLTILRDLREDRFSTPELVRYGDKIIAGDISTMTGVDELANLGESIFIPKQIAKSIRNIAVSSLIPSDDIENNPDKYVIIQYAGVKNTVLDIDSDKEIESPRKGLVNGKEITLKEYLKNFEDVYRACQKWLKKNSSIDLDLNS